jgi:hypothetical protein
MNPSNQPIQPTNVFNSIHLPSPVNRSAKAIIKEGGLTALKIARDARHTEMAMLTVAHLDTLRLQSATSPEANQLMFMLEAGFAQRSSRRISNQDSPFGDL